MLRVFLCFSLTLFFIAIDSAHAQEQNFVKVSQYVPGIVQLPTPQALHAPAEYQTNAPIRFGSLPHLSGPWEYCYSFIDEAGRISAQSPIATVVSPGANCMYTVSFPGIRLWQRSVGIVLWYRRPAGYPTTFGNALEYEWLVFGAQPSRNDPADAVRPCFPMSGMFYHRYRTHLVNRCVWYQGGQRWREYSDALFWPRSQQEAPTQAPVVTPHFFPDVPCKVAFSWVGHYGETATCQPFDVPAYSNNAANHAGINIIRVEQPPQGALGMHVYVKLEGGQWQRQPPPHSLNTYLWPLSANKLWISRYAESNLRPPVPDGRSYLCSLQQALWQSTKDVVVDVDQVTYSPVVNPLNNPQGTAIHRMITGQHGLKWTLSTGSTLPDQVQTTGFPMCWPMWLECTQGTKIINCTMQSIHAEGGVDFCDYGGSGAFYTSLRDCRIAIVRPFAAYTYGIRQTWEGTSINSHGWSDSDSMNIKIGAVHPIIIEGNQCLNITLRNLLLDGGSTAAGISVNNAASLKVDGITCESTRSLFDLVWCNQLAASDVFTDQGVPCYVNISHSTLSPSIDVNFRKVNHRTDWLHAVENSCGSRGTATVRMTCRESQPSVPVQAIIYSPRYVGVRYAIDPTGVFNNLINAQASLQWWQTNYDLAPAPRTYFEKWDNAEDIISKAASVKEYGIKP